jgi:dTDP-L-rhamnose 4-epimerase
MTPSKNKICLVTGGAGFIGSHTCEALLSRGYHVRILDNLHPRIHPKGLPEWISSDIEFIKGDATQRLDLESALSGVSYVFHLSAYQDYLPDFSTFFHTNVVSTALLYELIVEKEIPVEKVVVASSQAVYGEGTYQCSEHGKVFPELRPEKRLEKAIWDPLCPDCGSAITWTLTDESRINPQNAYAISKYSQELTALRLGRRYQIPTTAYRYSIVQGPRQSLFNAYSGACRIFCLSALLGKSLSIYEDGAQVRDFINIEDIVSANLLALGNSETNYRAFNVGGGKACTVLEFANIVAEVFAEKVQFEFTKKYRFGDTRHICSDISALQALGWKPEHSPKKSVVDYVKWLKEQVHVVDALTTANNNMKRLNVLRDTKSS